LSGGVIEETSSLRTAFGQFPSTSRRSSLSILSCFLIVRHAGYELIEHKGLGVAEI
jgi:hypothetical protein